MGMSIREYCSGVCGAKCCRERVTGHTCQHLGGDNLCGIYFQRFSKLPIVPEVVDFYPKDGEMEPLVCFTLTNPKVAQRLEPDIAALCCILHPELLK